MTLEERWKLDIPKPIPVPYEELSDEEKKEHDRLNARTEEEIKREGEAFMKWVDDVKAGKIDLQSPIYTADEVDDKEVKSKEE